MRSLTLLILPVLFLAGAGPAAAKCPGRFAVEVLGSGGPLADDNRAAASYLVWSDGEARFLIDAGGGAFLRFGESGARFETLGAILISHFHADHAGDLDALLKSASFGKRRAPLLIAGPTGSAHYPGMKDFLRANFDAGAGAYRYLAGIIAAEGPDDAFRLAPVEIDAGADTMSAVLDTEDFTVAAAPVNHGDAPALAFIVTSRGASVVFAGDQSLFSETFDRALAGARPDVLIAHHAIPGKPGQPRGLHRDPASIGEMAAALQAKRLILSHNMKRALDDWPAGRKAIRASYKGPVTIAEDGLCVTLAR